VVVHVFESVVEIGIWEGIVEGVGAGEYYKFYFDGCEKVDLMVFEVEVLLKIVFVVFELSYEWNDDVWMDECCI